MKALFGFLFISIFIYNCPCSAGSDLNYSTIFNAGRETKYGKNLEDRLDLYLEQITKNIPEEILAPVITLGGIIAGQELDIKIYNNNYLEYDYKDKKIMYKFSYNFD